MYVHAEGHTIVCGTSAYVASSVQSWGWAVLHCCNVGHVCMQVQLGGVCVHAGMGIAGVQGWGGAALSQVRVCVALGLCPGSGCGWYWVPGAGMCLLLQRSPPCLLPRLAAANRPTVLYYKRHWVFGGESSAGEAWR